MIPQDTTKTIKADGSGPLLQKIPAVIQELFTLGDLLHRHMNANREDQSRLAAEIDQVADKVLSALPEKPTPPEIQIICGTPPSIYSIRLLSLLLRESLINAGGIYFVALASTAQMGQSEAFLPLMVALAELKVAGFVEDHDGWIRVSPTFLRDVVHIPSWLAPQMKALVEHNHKTDDEML